MAAKNIAIGNNVRIGANTIIDIDFHLIDPIQRYLHPQAAKTASVVIEDDFFYCKWCIST